jgi:hypothetical protein
MEYRLYFISMTFQVLHDSPSGRVSDSSHSSSLLPIEIISKPTVILVRVEMGLTYNHNTSKTAPYTTCTIPIEGQSVYVEFQASDGPYDTSSVMRAHTPQLIHLIPFLSSCICRATEIEHSSSLPVLTTYYTVTWILSVSWFMPFLSHYPSAPLDYPDDSG